MPTHATAQYPYRWADGSYHSRPQNAPAIPGWGQPNPAMETGANARPATPVASYTPPVAPPQPVDSALEQAKLTAGRNVALGNSESAYATGNLGFDAGYNPDGSLNTSNPYSRAALLQLSHTNQVRGNTNSFAAQGQLYSGALQNAQGIADSDYARNEAANRLGYQRGLHGIQAGQLSNYANNALGIGDADFNALLKATYPGS